MDYSQYELSDFVTDAHFRKWVLEAAAEDNDFWTQWLSTHPGQQVTIAKARVLVLALRSGVDSLPASEQEAQWERLAASITTRQSVSLFTSRWYRAAASLALLLLGTALLFFWQNSSRIFHHQTGYGEVRTVTLPDGSVITLNANSELTLARQWDAQHGREVWLKGEGFFRITKKTGAGNARFVVHTSELDVEVLGTTFNVNSRRNQTQVVLNTGKIQLSVPKQQRKERVLMQPGEWAEYSRAKPALVKKKVTPRLYATWTQHVLTMDHMTLAELGRMIEDTYGTRVVITDSTLAKRVLNGTLPTENEETLLKAIGGTLDIQVSRQKGVVFLQP